MFAGRQRVLKFAITFGISAFTAMLIAAFTIPEFQPNTSARLFTVIGLGTSVSAFFLMRANHIRSAAILFLSAVFAIWLGRMFIDLPIERRLMNLAWIAVINILMGLFLPIKIARVGMIAVQSVVIFLPLFREEFRTPLMLVMAWNTTMVTIFTITQATVSHKEQQIGLAAMAR